MKEGAVELKVAFLTPEYVMPDAVSGGLGSYLRKTAAGLSQLGCQVWVFVRSTRDAVWVDGGATVCEVRCPAGLPAVTSRIPGVRGFLPLWQQVAASGTLSRAFWRRHATVSFDVVQVSSYEAPGLPLLGNGKVPVVCRHSSYSPMVRAAYGWKSGMAEWLSDRRERAQARGADACFAPSSYVAAAFRQVGSRPVSILRTPPELAEVAADPAYFLAHRPAGPYLLYFGTLSRIKGVDLLAEALPPVLSRHPTLSVVFAGRDDGLPSGEKVFDFLLRSCPECAQRLHYHPALPKAALTPFIADAEAVLMPSRVDNYPNACLEAQTMCKAVIGTYGSSLEEMIEEGRTGFLAQNGDAASIGEAIERYLALSGAERVAMQERIAAAMALVREEDRVGQLLDFYREVVAEFRRDRAR